jgi:hypothetical protein
MVSGWAPHTGQTSGPPATPSADGRHWWPFGQVNTWDMECFPGAAGPGERMITGPRRR